VTQLCHRHLLANALAKRVLSMESGQAFCNELFFPGTQWLWPFVNLLKLYYCRIRGHRLTRVKIIHAATTLNSEWQAKFCNAA
jgi:hypothetical protein